jgi:hypothetical protein
MVSPYNGSRKRAKKQVKPQKRNTRQPIPHEKEPQYSWWKEQWQSFLNNPAAAITKAVGVIYAISQGIEKLTHLVK